MNPNQTWRSCPERERKLQPEKPLLFRNKPEEQDLQTLAPETVERENLCKPSLCKPPAALAASRRCGKWAVEPSAPHPFKGAQAEILSLHRDNAMEGWWPVTASDGQSWPRPVPSAHFFNHCCRSFTTMWLEPQTSPARAQSITLRPLEVSFSTSTPSSKRISSTSYSPCMAATWIGYTLSRLKKQPPPRAECRSPSLKPLARRKLLRHIRRIMRSCRGPNELSMLLPHPKDLDVFGVCSETVVLRESGTTWKGDTGDATGDTFLRSVRADFGDGTSVAKFMASGKCTRFCYSDNPLGVTGFSRIFGSLRLQNWSKSAWRLISDSFALPGSTLEPYNQASSMISHQDCPNGNQINYIDVLTKFATFAIILLVARGFKAGAVPFSHLGCLWRPFPGGPDRHGGYGYLCGGGKGAFSNTDWECSPTLIIDDHGDDINSIGMQPSTINFVRREKKQWTPSDKNNDKHTSSTAQGGGGSFRIGNL